MENEITNKLQKVGELKTQFIAEGLIEKVDFVNKAIEYLYLAQQMIDRAAQISVNILAEEYPRHSEF